MTKTNISLLNGKPIEKLIDVISKGIGVLYKPIAIKKEAEAEAYKIEIIERAKLKAQLEGKELEVETLTRIENRILFQELKKQRNIDSISHIAAEQLEHISIVSDQQVDDYWTQKFFKNAEDISDNEMQQLWGKILAGEVECPKSYSLRTLDLLKNLSKDEANIFIKFVKAKLVIQETAIIFKNDNNDFLKIEFEITFHEQLILMELGLIYSENFLSISLNENPKIPSIDIIEYGRKAIVINRKDDAPKVDISVIMFTKIGYELSKLVEINIINTNYLDFVCSLFKHPEVTIEIGDIIKNESGEKEIVNKIIYNNYP